MPPEPGPLFRELLEAPDRDWTPGARPLVSYRSDEEPEELNALLAAADATVRLERRGVDHGDLAVLPARFAPPDLGHPLPAILERRWHTGRPLFVPRLAGDLSPEDVAQRIAWLDELRVPGGLAAWTRRRPLEPDFTLDPPHENPSERSLGREARQPSGAASGPPLGAGDPERDLERLHAYPSGLVDPGRAPWLKTGRLSTHPADASLRLRVSFGHEGADDASRDLARHLEVTRLAERLFPEARDLAARALAALPIEDWLGGPAFFTQHIAYWNAPAGGALFHHDAFAETADGGQRGVLYTQLVGRTAWLALSIDDLARRVVEFAEYLIEGELPWVRRQLFRDAADLERILRWGERFGRLLDELAKPGCGVLGPLVNQGPEFTALLADAGHAFLLEPGDALLLPNQGYRATAMHSVFCASDGPTYALSMALRELEPPPLEVSEATSDRGGAPSGTPSDSPPRPRHGPSTASEARPSRPPVGGPRPARRRRRRRRR